MKILHLADLHIGKYLLNESLYEDQKYILNETINLIKEENISTILISGDVYDRSVPPGDAVSLLNNFLKTLIIDLKRNVFIISGNHDSKERLNFGSDIFKNLGLYISTSYNGKIDKITLKDDYGNINFYLLPYIKPVDIKDIFNESIDSYDDAIKKIMKNEKINIEERNIILSHQFVTSNTFSPERSESETLFLGGVENVDVSNYDLFDYVALGHIHGPQKIGRDTCRYAGTLLKYSFSEANHNKVYTIIDIKEKGNISLSYKEVKPLRDMRIIKGPIDELIKYDNYKNNNLDDFIKAIITDEDLVYDAIGKIRSVYKNTLKLEVDNSRTKEILNNNMIDIEKIKMRNEMELFEDFYKMQNNISLNDKQENIIKDILDELKKGD